jgi:hypothetical protein
LTFTQSLTNFDKMIKYGEKFRVYTNIQHKTMGYSIRISDDNSFILVSVDGIVDSGLALEYTVKSHQLGKEHGILNFLIDLVNARNKQSPVENYDFVISDLDESHFIDRRAKVAMLVSPGDDSHNFVETISRYSGYNVKIFRKLEDALEFLKEA